MAKLTEKINCADCGAERMITKACLKLVSRCKPCQKAFNRNRARNRYREINGIPLDKPVIQQKKKTPKPAEATEEVVVTEEKAPPVSTKTPEERKMAIERLISLFGSDGGDDVDTVDDW
jgi:hypothetical protein